MTTTTENIEKSTFQEFTIVKNYDLYTVKITRESKRARFGYKMVCHYSFRRNDISASIMQMNMFVDKFIAEKTKAAEAKEQKKAALQAARKEVKHSFEVGQIFYKSWGYEQTNVNFYQITAIKGKTVILREVAQNRTETGWLTGTCSAIKNEFIGEEIKKVIQIRMYNDKVIVDINNVSPWDGRPLHWSAYA